MGGSVFVAALMERVRQARAALDVALEDADAYAVAVARDELDDAVRVARSHRVDVGPVKAEAEGE